jgi:putative methionine-R-sulfoxide reductase with GAF domain
VGNPPHPWTDDELIARGISYRGRGLAVSAEPFAPDAESMALVRRRVAIASAAAERVAEAFASDAEVRSLYGYGALQEACVLKDPGYRPLIPLGRWDAFLFPDGPHFMEYNTDGAAGWHYSAALSALWREWANLPPERVPLPRKLLDTLLFCFHQWDRRGVESPRMAIVDWAEVGTRSEQEALASVFTAWGTPAFVEDPRALRAEGGRLRGAHGAYDLVYRRVVSEEVFPRSAEIMPFIDAYLEDAACFVGSFRTDPAWGKALFVLLSDPHFSRLFPQDLRESLNSCIPWSRVLVRGPVVFDGRAHELQDLLLARREEFLLKPLKSYEGRDVLAGPLTPPEVWRGAVLKGLERRDTLVQTMLQPAPFPSEYDGRPLYMQPGEYVLLGRLAGFLARSGATPLITPDNPERYHPVAVEVPWSIPRDYERIVREIRGALTPGATRGERMRRVVDLLWSHLHGSGVAWLGFYEIAEAADSMLLTVCRPRPACSPIGLHGVCGKAWKARASQIVDDVHALGASHIVCDPSNLSEVVVPCLDSDESCWGVLDLDSRSLASFTEEDARGLRRILKVAGLTV